MATIKAAPKATNSVLLDHHEGNVHAPLPQSEHGYATLEPQIDPVHANAAGQAPDTLSYTGNAGAQNVKRGAQKTAAGSEATQPTGVKAGS